MELLSIYSACSISTDDILNQYNVSKNGLSDASVIKRRNLYGDNTIPTIPPIPLWKKYIEQFSEPLIIILLCSGLISFIIGQYDDAISIILAVLVVTTVAFVQEYRSQQSLLKLKKLCTAKTRCMRNNTVRIIEAHLIVPGDIILLSAGEKIASDCRFISTSNLFVDESVFTGESQPNGKNSNPIILQDKNICNLTNVGLMGTIIVNGEAMGMVITPAKFSEFGQILSMVQSEVPPLTILQVSMRKLGRQLTLLFFIIVVCILILGLIQNRSFLEMLTISVSLAVAVIPEGLPVVVTVTLAIGIVRMSKKNVIIKKMSTVEALGSIKCVCFDKTGTITKNEMTVISIFTSCSSFYKISGMGYSSYGRINNSTTNDYVQWNMDTFINKMDNFRTSMNSLEKLLTACVICNNATINIEGDELTHIGYPTEIALLIAATKAGLSVECIRNRFIKIMETPFNSETKCMDIQVQIGSSQAVWFVKGAPEIILERCKFFFGNNGNDELNQTVKDRFCDQQILMCRRGLR
ncbi:hypothetical protein A3Q56_02516, partial [Intoshia linei]